MNGYNNGSVMYGDRALSYTINTILGPNKCGYYGICTSAPNLVVAGSSVTSAVASGTYNYGLVYSSGSSMFPSNGALGSYWFKYQGTR